MKNRVKKIITIALIICFIGIIGLSNKSYAGFADYDDVTADKQGNEDLKEQELEDEKNAGKSSNNYLSKLSVEGYELTPVFDKQIIEYSINEQVTANTIKIDATADDERAAISGIGEVNLQTGENNLRVTVKAENGVERTYFIKVTKKIGAENLKLSSLKLTAISNAGDKQEIYLDKDFSSNIFMYNCEVYSDINKIELEAISEKANTDIKIQGNENLQEGQNTITISLKDENNNETIYKIQVNKQRSIANEIIRENGNTTIVIAIITAILLVIIIIIFINEFKGKGSSRKH